MQRAEREHGRRPASPSIARRSRRRPRPRCRRADRQRDGQRPRQPGRRAGRGRLPALPRRRLRGREPHPHADGHHADLQRRVDAGRRRLRGTVRPAGHGHVPLARVLQRRRQQRRVAGAVQRAEREHGRVAHLAVDRDRRDAELRAGRRPAQRQRDGQRPRQPDRGAGRGRLPPVPRRGLRGCEPHPHPHGHDADATTARRRRATADSGAPFDPPGSGTYRWRAFYSGDDNNAAVAGACNAPNENTIGGAGVADDRDRRHARLRPRCRAAERQRDGERPREPDRGAGPGGLPAVSRCRLRGPEPHPHAHGHDADVQRHADAGHRRLAPAIRPARRSFSVCICANNFCIIPCLFYKFKYAKHVTMISNSKRRHIIFRSFFV